MNTIGSFSITLKVVSPIFVGGGDGAISVLWKLTGESRTGVMVLFERKAEEIATWLKRDVENRWITDGCSTKAGKTAER